MVFTMFKRREMNIPAGSNYQTRDTLNVRIRFHIAQQGSGFPLKKKKRKEIKGRKEGRKEKKKKIKKKERKKFSLKKGLKEKKSKEKEMKRKEKEEKKRRSEQQATCRISSTNTSVSVYRMYSDFVYYTHTSLVERARYYCAGDMESGLQQ
jgi:hypothetical protein